MEALLTLLSTIWEFIKLLVNMFWQIITFIPEAIGLPGWAVILVGIGVIIAILGLKRISK